jgi:hypothetical protein
MPIFWRVKFGGGARILQPGGLSLWSQPHFLSPSLPILPLPPFLVYSFASTFIRILLSVIIHFRVAHVSARFPDVVIPSSYHALFCSSILLFLPVFFFTIFIGGSDIVFEITIARMWVSAQFGNENRYGFTRLSWLCNLEYALVFRNGVLPFN